MYNPSSTRQLSRSYTINSADTWERKILTIPGDTSGGLTTGTGAGMRCNWYLAAGTSYTSGSNQATWSAYSVGNTAPSNVNLLDSTSNEWYLTGVQLEIGSEATPYEHRSLAEELLLCQRYFQKSFAVDVTPAVSVSKCIYTFTRPYTSGYHEALGNDYVVEMRSQPSVTFYPIQGSGSAGQVSYYDSGWANTSASYHTGHSTSKRLVFSINTTSSTTLVQYNYTLESEL